jgi:hypothetical protein
VKLLANFGLSGEYSAIAAFDKDGAVSSRHTTFIRGLDYELVDTQIRYWKKQVFELPDVFHRGPGDTPAIGDEFCIWKLKEGVLIADQYDTNLQRENAGWYSWDLVRVVFDMAMWHQNMLACNLTKQALAEAEYAVEVENWQPSVSLQAIGWTPEMTDLTELLARAPYPSRPIAGTNEFLQGYSKTPSGQPSQAMSGWHSARIVQELDAAFANKSAAPEGLVGVSPSGVRFLFKNFDNSPRSWHFYPLE